MDKKIKEFTDRIAKAYNPESIILFGSYAAGNAGRDSDVDLLIILDFEGKAANKAAEIRLKFHPEFPLDILVRTPQKVRERIDLGDCFMKEIIEKGKVLYEAYNA